MRKRIGIILCSILVLCALAACKKPSEDDVSKPTATPVLVTQTPMPTGEDIPLTVAPSKTTELPIYTLSGDLTELTAVTALITEDEIITEQVVAEAVMEALADSMIYVKVNQVTRKNDIIVVDFDASAPPVSQVGASIEGLILDAFGQSILDNISDCRGIGFTADGGDYASGHFEFGENDIYMRR